MTNQLPEPGHLGDFNERNNANQWHPRSIVELCTVSWDAQYRDIVDFENREALNSYITNQRDAYHKLERLTHIRPYEPIRLNIPLHTVLDSNYIHVYNPSQPIDGDQSKHFYYFILDARYIAPNTTELMLQLDVWQTYGFDYEVGNSYVERGHVGIANDASNNTGYGSRYLTVPEGLDQGNEYNVIVSDREKIADTNDFSILVWATTRIAHHDSDNLYGSEDDPKMYTALGSEIEGVPNAAGATVFKDRKTFQKWLTDMSEFPWITQGIIGVYAIPPWTRYRDAYTPPNDNFDTDRWSAGSHKSKAKTVILAKHWRDTYMDRVPTEYSHLNKFLTYPYTIVEVTTYTGAPIVLKPEQLNGADVRLREIAYLAQPSPRVVITPLFYNKYQSSEVPDGLNDGGEFLDISTGIYDFPTFSVVNNGYMSFMASNRHSIQHQHSQADWSQQKALRGADTSYDQATMGIDAANNQSANQIHQMTGSNAIHNSSGAARAGVSGLTSLGMGAMGGTPMSMIGGVTSAATTGLNEAISQNERNHMTTLNTGAAKQASGIQETLSTGIRDSNQSLAKFSARGDYAQAQAAINAKVQDAKMIQPTINGQMGGEAFNLAAHGWGYDVKIKTVSDGAMRMIGDFWLRYGYAINQPMSPWRLQVMQKFSYWKFQEYVIRKARMPEQYKYVIRGIFEKGVTVWGDPDDIGYVDIEANAPRYANYYK